MLYEQLRKLRIQPLRRRSRELHFIPLIRPYRPCVRQYPKIGMARSCKTIRWKKRKRRDEEGGNGKNGRWNGSCRLGFSGYGTEVEEETTGSERIINLENLHIGALRGQPLTDYDACRIERINQIETIAPRHHSSSMIRTARRYRQLSRRRGLIDTKCRSIIDVRAQEQPSAEDIYKRDRFAEQMRVMDLESRAITTASGLSGYRMTPESFISSRSPQPLSD